MTGLLSLGIAAAAGADLAARIAPAVERAGLHALWVNDTLDHDALEVLAAAADTTDRLVLATGVLPMDRRTADEVLERIEQLGLPLERLVLGIGSGAGAAGALARVREAAGVLRAEVTARVVVGALGPKMRRLGAEGADGLVLSWLTPEAVRVQTAAAHDASPGTHAAVYVRTATDPRAVARLDDEARRYAGYPAYAAHFSRLGIDPGETVIRPDALASRIADYRAAADEVVLRAIVEHDTAEACLQFLGDVTAAVDG